jgi:hypothetical protein
MRGRWIDPVSGGLRTVCAVAALSLVLVGCAPRASGVAPPPAGEGPRRAILISLDALSEARLYASLDSAFVPDLRAMFEEGACASHAIAAFPTLTAPGHAAIWTGAFGDVNGVSGNRQPLLPRDRHTLLEGGSGYAADPLRAEPMWITAARQGVPVVGLHVTQAPQPPGYLPIDGERDARLRERRAEAERVLERPELAVFNGYNRSVAPQRILTQDGFRPQEARGWRNLERLGSGVAPLEIGWAVEDDSIFALFHGAQVYDRVLIARGRDAAAGVVARALPHEREPVRGRSLARHFSEALEVPVEGGRVFVRARLYELAPDASSYLLYVPALNVVEGNTPEVLAEYDAVVRGWVGNSPLRDLSRGAFGPTLLDGGDGTAEQRYLEALELVTRQFMRGVDWAWDTKRARLLLDYFPVADEIDHGYYGYLDPAWPEYSEEAARQVQWLRQRVWEIVDLRYAHLRDLVRNDPNAVLFVAGDHGMRTSWQMFRPNVALREAGLLEVDSLGFIDVTRTRALSPNGYWISVNRTAWKDGIVPPHEEAEVVAAVERALLAARDASGRPIVTAVYRADQHPELGLGGPTGGDVYFNTGQGVRWSSDARGELLGPASIFATHGYPSTDPDMWTAFCAVGGPLAPRRTGTVRLTDVAPTVAEWLGIEAPRDAVGRSVWPELLGQQR